MRHLALLAAHLVFALPMVAQQPPPPNGPPAEQLAAPKAAAALELIGTIRGSPTAEQPLGTAIQAKSGDAIPSGKLLIVTASVEGVGYMVEALVDGSMTVPEYVESGSSVLVVIPEKGQVRVTGAATIGGKTRFASFVARAGGKGSVVGSSPPSAVPNPPPASPPVQPRPPIAGRLHITIIDDATQKARPVLTEFLATAQLVNAEQLRTTNPNAVAVYALGDHRVALINSSDPAHVQYMNARGLAGYWRQISPNPASAVPALIIMRDPLPGTVTGKLEVAQPLPATAAELAGLLQRLTGR